MNVGSKKVEKKLNVKKRLRRPLGMRSVEKMMKSLQDRKEYLKRARLPWNNLKPQWLNVRKHNMTLKKWTRNFKISVIIY